MLPLHSKYKKSNANNGIGRSSREDAVTAFYNCNVPAAREKRRVDSSLLLSFVRQMYRLIFSFNSLAMSLGVIEELGKMLLGAQIILNINF